MIKRNKQLINVIWLHMDVTHDSYAAAIIAMRVQHKTQGPFELSVNLSEDGTEALVKVVGVLPPWIVGKPFENAVIRVFTEADHDEAVVLVRDLLWEPESEPELA